LCIIATANSFLFTEMFSQYKNISNALRIYSRYITYYTPQLIRIVYLFYFLNNDTINIDWHPHSNAFWSLPESN
jgi:hypothetical protein